MKRIDETERAETNNEKSRKQLFIVNFGLKMCLAL